MKLKFSHFSSIVLIYHNAKLSIEKLETKILMQTHLAQTNNTKCSSFIHQTTIKTIKNNYVYIKM